MKNNCLNLCDSIPLLIFSLRVSKASIASDDDDSENDEVDQSTEVNQSRCVYKLDASKPFDQIDITPYLKNTGLALEVSDGTFRHVETTHFDTSNITSERYEIIVAVIYEFVRKYRKIGSFTSLYLPPVLIEVLLTNLDCCKVVYILRYCILFNGSSGESSKKKMKKK